MSSGNYQLYLSTLQILAGIEFKEFAEAIKGHTFNALDTRVPSFLERMRDIWYKLPLGPRPLPTLERMMMEVHEWLMAERNQYIRLGLPEDEIDPRGDWPFVH